MNCSTYATTISHSFSAVKFAHLTSYSSTEWSIFVFSADRRETILIWFKSTTDTVRIACSVRSNAWSTTTWNRRWWRTRKAMLVRRMISFWMQQHPTSIKWLAVSQQWRPEQHNLHRLKAVMLALKLTDGSPEVLFRFRFQYTCRNHVSSQHRIRRPCHSYCP